MTYSALELKAEVEAELASGYEPIRLAKRAFQIYFEKGRDLDPALDATVMRLVAMEEGSEFELSEEEVLELLDQL